MDTLLKPHVSVEMTIQATHLALHQPSGACLSQVDTEVYFTLLLSYRKSCRKHAHGVYYLQYHLGYRTIHTKQYSTLLLPSGQ